MAIGEKDRFKAELLGADGSLVTESMCVVKESSAAMTRTAQHRASNRASMRIERIRRGSRIGIK